MSIFDDVPAIAGQGADRAKVIPGPIERAVLMQVFDGVEEVTAEAGFSTAQARGLAMALTLAADEVDNRRKRGGL